MGWALLAGACLMALPMAAAAQAGQTAEGAQAFLAAMAQRGLARATFIDPQGRANHVTGTYEVKTTRIWLSAKEEASSNPIERSLGEMVVAGLASGDLQGAPDACSTRITGVQGPANLFEMKPSSWEEPGFGVSVSVMRMETWNYSEGFSAFAGEHAIDWRQAKVARSNDGSRIDISVPGQKFATNILSFVPGDTELGDRIEYAAKFLRMSCDEIAATGF
ncbi:hypothetical protein [Lysobacter sp. D1-1-M9]|uniref:hypothetical protein n=1 Tax=Novilysobacter longmucuonensis TaxID=3098603 RepID=UPI002FCBF9EE